jgi:hypothetical protein
VNVAHLDGDANGHLSDRFNVTGFPSLFVRLHPLRAQIPLITQTSTHAHAQFVLEGRVWEYRGDREEALIIQFVLVH